MQFMESSTGEYAISGILPVNSHGLIAKKKEEEKINKNQALKFYRGIVTALVPNIKWP